MVVIKNNEMIMVSGRFLAGFLISPAIASLIMHECIRRHYVGGESPLSNVLGRYSDFFNLFGNFKSYVEFFHLQNVVSDDFKKVKFFLPFDDFQRVPTPKTKEEYMAYRQAVMLFINQRNTRILDSL